MCLTFFNSWLEHWSTIISSNVCHKVLRSATQPNETAAAGYTHKAKVNSLIAHLYFAATPTNVMHPTISSNDLAAGVTAIFVTALVSMRLDGHISSRGWGIEHC